MNLGFQYTNNVGKKIVHTNKEGFSFLLWRFVRFAFLNPLRSLIRRHLYMGKNERQVFVIRDMSDHNISEMLKRYGR